MRSSFSDGLTQKILKYDLNGKLLHGWGTFGAFPGGLWGVHQINVDSEGNLYLAEVFNGRVQKFRPKPGAERARLIAQTTHSLTKRYSCVDGVRITAACD